MYFKPTTTKNKKVTLIKQGKEQIIQLGKNWKLMPNETKTQTIETRKNYLVSRLYNFTPNDKRQNTL